MKKRSNSFIPCLLLLALLLAAAAPTASAEEAGWQFSETFGPFGRFVIEELGFAVPLTRSDPKAGNAQAICDAWDSAVYDRPEYKDLPIIADHVDQGFTVIKHCVPGETVSYIETESGREEFLCAAIDFDCRNTGYQLLDSEGNDIDARYGVGWLVTYTCNEDWEHVTVVLWEKAGGPDPLEEEYRAQILAHFRQIKRMPY